MNNLITTKRRKEQRTNEIHVLTEEKKVNIGYKTYNLPKGYKIPIYLRAEEEPSEYEIESDKLLKEMGVTIDIDFLYTGLHFQDDKEIRDIYNITFKGLHDNKIVRKAFTIKYGNSTHDSNYTNIVLNNNDREISQNLKFKTYKSKVPSAYDILTCIQKYPIEPVLEDFCNEFGYNDDSIKAKATWEACLREYRDVSRFFTSEELEQLQEVQ